MTEMRLSDIPRAERRAALAELVGQEFKRALLMSQDEELPVDDNYFDLGLTSLKAAELKQRLEEKLGCELETPVLFASATVRQIVDHLCEVVLPDLVPTPTPGTAEADHAGAPAQAQRNLVDDLLKDLYDN